MKDGHEILPVLTNVVDLTLLEPTRSSRNFRSSAMQDAPGNPPSRGEPRLDHNPSLSACAPNGAGVFLIWYKRNAANAAHGLVSNLVLHVLEPVAGSQMQKSGIPKTLLNPVRPSALHPRQQEIREIA
ncbi:hypothetical protein [Rhizobium leguminosarum]|uniref:hypothetical protein n=1 Tax=Rhizobium leguminosarum TaxID=384 RepID=UPI001495BC53|nr:hypothetical protein [Rhizobium leguminosarum]